MSSAVDASRRHEWNRLRENGRLKNATDLKGRRFLLLRNPENLVQWQKEAMERILGSHSEIATVYGLKESLRDTWEFDNGYDAAHHLLSWLLTAERTGIGALKNIVRLVDNHFSEILSWFRSGMNNGVMEGLNSVIQAVKRRARGYKAGRIFVPCAIYVVRDSAETYRSSYCLVRPRRSRGREEAYDRRSYAPFSLL